MRILVLVAMVVSSSFAYAGAKACSNDGACAKPERCVKVEAGRACARVCEPKAGSCPADQRCVKDGPSMVCRPVRDDVGL